MLGAFQLAFSHFAFAVDSNPGTSSSEINVDLVNGIAVRILDEAGQQQIDNINLDLTAVPGGSFVSGKFNVEVSTSNKTGYKLYMDSSYDQSSVMGTTSPDYTTNLVNQVNTSYAIPTLANNVSLAEFQSGSNSSSNKWGYSLDNTSFSPIPAHNAPAEVDSSSTPTASGLTPVTIGTNVNMDMASGTYKNQLTFSAVAEPVPSDYSLYFEPGTTDTVTNLPETMTYSGVATSHTFTIPATAPTRTGYNFTGYLDESTSTTYQAGDSITVVGDIDYTGSATLTAQWEQMQLIAACNSAASGQTFYNNNVLYIKLTDGNCYTKNSQGTSAWGSNGATYPDISVCPSGTSVPTADNFRTLISNYGADNLGNITGWSGLYWSSTPLGTNRAYYLSVYSATAEVLDYYRTNQHLITCIVRTPQNTTLMQQMDSNVCAAMNINDSNTLTDTRDNNTYIIKKLKDNKCWITQNLKLTGQRTLTPSDSNVSSSWTLPATNTSFPTSCVNTAYNMNSGNTAYGNYYNWYAATAGTGTCAMTSGNATASICPKGWRLPTGGSSGEFKTLYNQYASSALMQGDPAFVLSGYRGGSSTAVQGSRGYYWSSTANSSINAYDLNLVSSSVDPAGLDSKYLGFTVRCVAQ